MRRHSWQGYGDYTAAKLGELRRGYGVIAETTFGDFTAGIAGKARPYGGGIIAQTSAVWLV
jgi:hypothetical protein